MDTVNKIKKRTSKQVKSIPLQKLANVLGPLSNDNYKWRLLENLESDTGGRG